MAGLGRSGGLRDCGCGCIVGAMASPEYSVCTDAPPDLAPWKLCPGLVFDIAGWPVACFRRYWNGWYTPSMDTLH